MQNSSDPQKDKKKSDMNGGAENLNTEHVEHITNNTSWNPENFVPGASVKDSAGTKSMVSANSGSANEDNNLENAPCQKQQFISQRNVQGSSQQLDGLTEGG